MELNKTYEPILFEKEIYASWEEKSYFKAYMDKNKNPYCIVIPPPNITGQLHVGHALNNTMQDIMIRFKRMQGYSVLWQPGTDHASIATELKIIEQMKSEGISKADIGRDGFLERAWKWKDNYGGKIVSQLKRLGVSCDWSREAFTMDDNCSKAVSKVFVSLYNEGLIYKGDRIINWCPCCKTALSDAEVEYDEKSGFLWHIKYPLENSSEYIVIATTRPETMLGDTALAVNPKDKRYKKLVGKNVLLPLTDRIIPIVEDDYVEKDFGSGVVKITPAHDPNDYEVGIRHNLPILRVMNDDGSMNSLAGKDFEGLDRYDCRELVIRKLQDKGLMLKIEPYTHNVGACYRCGKVVEPIVSKQWFVKMQPLAQPALDIVKIGDINFYPSRFTKTYYNWMENIKDWCISRQLWWGHRIPAYYCENCGEITVSESEVKSCCNCNSNNVKQDEDVLDTWFSSALWPFSTLGYPNKSEFLDYFYPTNVLITAYDIIFFWVARMIFSGLKQMNEKPFHDVLIHGIVRDAQGRKMSKSLGNGIDPLEIIEKYGADTLRFSLINGISPGSDIKYSVDKIESARNFMNKLWNASRYVLINSENSINVDISKINLTYADKWILSKLNDLIDNTTKNLDKYEMGLVATNLYDFIWFDFCDWYIELTKPALYSGILDKKNNAITVLKYVLNCILKLISPFTPFIAEKIYAELNNDKSLMLEEWAKVNEKLNFKDDAENFALIMDIIRNIRNIRAEYEIKPSKPLTLNIIVKGENKILINSANEYIIKLAGIESINFFNNANEITEKSISIATTIAELYIPMGELVDIEKEKERINSEILKMNSEIQRCEKMLSNKSFNDKAPQALVDKEKEKLTNYNNIKQSLIIQLDGLKFNE